jgi:hypothetical protein
MKFAAEHPYSDPEKVARKLVEIANSIEPAQDGRIFIELINWPFLSEQKDSPAEYKAGLEAAISRGWLALHRHQGRHADAGLHAFAARAGRMERAVDLPRRSMVDQPDEMRAGRIRS